MVKISIFLEELKLLHGNTMDFVPPPAGKAGQCRKRMNKLMRMTMTRPWMVGMGILFAVVETRLTGELDNTSDGDGIYVDGGLTDVGGSMGGHVCRDHLG